MKKTATKATKIETSTTAVTPRRRTEPSLEKQIEMFKALIQAVATGRKEMQLVCSPPGLGKTTIVTKELKKHGIKVKTQNPDNVYAFSDALYRCRNDDVIVFDDSEKLLSSVAIMNIAKQAFGPQHLVVHETRETQKNERRPDEDSDDYENRRKAHIRPSRFKIKCRLIMLSNEDYSKKENIPEHLKSHFEALDSRGLNPYWIETSGSPQKDLEMCLYTLNLAPQMLSDHGISLAASQLAINWFVEYRNYIKELTPRTIADSAKLFQGIEKEKAEVLLDAVLTADRNLPEIVPPRFLGQNAWSFAVVKSEVKRPFKEEMSPQRATVIKQAGKRRKK